MCSIQFFARALGMRQVHSPTITCTNCIEYQPRFAALLFAIIRRRITDSNVPAHASAMMRGWSSTLWPGVLKPWVNGNWSPFFIALGLCNFNIEKKVISFGVPTVFFYLERNFLFSLAICSEQGLWKFTLSSHSVGYRWPTPAITSHKRDIYCAIARNCEP